MVTNKRTKLILVIILVVIVFIGGYYVRDFLDKQKKISGVNDYKKGFYEGLLCEYNCPMSMQTMSLNGTNKTQMLPTLDCVKGCTGPFKAKFAGANYTKAELEKDNLLKDIDGVVNNCKKTSMNMTALKLDNVAYFNCAAKGIEGLKVNYTYLNN